MKTPVSKDTNSRGAGEAHKSIAGPEIRVGTCGYAFEDWISAGFYPPETKTSRMLPLYAQAFSVVELNHTGLHMPVADSIERLQQAVPPEFRFVAKLFQRLTEEAEEAGWQKYAVAFRDAINPLVQSRQLAAVLAQFPVGFERTLPRRQYLRALCEELAGLPLALEFGSHTWLTDTVYAELAKRRITLVRNDLAGAEAVNNPAMFYVRFNGRQGGAYAESELLQWAQQRLPSLLEQAGSGLVIFANTARAHAAHNARRLLRLLKEYGVKAG